MGIRIRLGRLGKCRPHGFSWPRQEVHGHRRAHRNALSGRLKAARLAIDGENTDGVRVLVRRQEPAPRRIHTKASGSFSSRRLMLHRRQGTFPRIHAKDRDAVMTAIGCINESTRGMDENLGRPVVAVKIRGQRGHRGTRRELTSHWVIHHRRDRRVHFVEGVSPAAIRVKSEMAWSSRRCPRSQRSIMRQQGSVCRIQAIN